MLYVRILIKVWLSLVTTVSFSQGWPSCPSTVHKLYCAIIKINPSIDKDYALTLSNYIYKASAKYNTDPLRTVAIAAQESMFRNIHRQHTVLELVEDCSEGDCIEYMRSVRGYTDIGVYQFHAATIKNYGMDAIRLRDDIEYATDRHAYLLSVKLKECADLGKDAWVCYHSRTLEHREKYKRMVNKYYNMIIGE